MYPDFLGRLIWIYASYCSVHWIYNAYFTGGILHEHAADFQKRKPFEVGCNKFLLFWHVLLNWYVELYYFPILINFPKLNDKFRRKKGSHVKPKNVGKLLVTQAAQSNKQSRPWSNLNCLSFQKITFSSVQSSTCTLSKAAIYLQIGPGFGNTPQRTIVFWSVANQSVNTIYWAARQAQS